MHTRIANKYFSNSVHVVEECKVKLCGREQAPMHGNSKYSNAFDDKPASAKHGI